jgi:hypothetical protein
LYFDDRLVSWTGQDFEGEMFDVGLDFLVGETSTY